MLFRSEEFATISRLPGRSTHAHCRANSSVNTRRLWCRFFHHGSGKYTCTAATLHGGAHSRRITFASAQVVFTFGSFRMAKRVAA